MVPASKKVIACYVRSKWSSCRDGIGESIPGIYVCTGVMALLTAMILCARSQDSLLSVSVRMVHVVFSAAGFKGGGKPSPKTRDTAMLRRGIYKASCT